MCVRKALIYRFIYFHHFTAESVYIIKPRKRINHEGWYFVFENSHKNNSFHKKIDSIKGKTFKILIIKAIVKVSKPTLVS